jgi:hypothetical protein
VERIWQIVAFFSTAQAGIENIDFPDSISISFLNEFSYLGLHHVLAGVGLRSKFADGESNSVIQTILECGSE